VYGWGSTETGAIGFNQTGRPQIIAQSKRVLKIAQGKQHSVFISENGQVKVIGLNQHGQLGIGFKSVKE